MKRPFQLPRTRTGQSQEPPRVVELLRSSQVAAFMPAASHRLLYVSRGKIAVEFAGARWLVRRDRAMWLPDGHAARIFEDPATTVVVIRVPDTIDRPIGPVVVSALLRAAVLKLVELSRRPSGQSDVESHLLIVIPDELKQLPGEPMLVPMPSDERLRALAECLQGADGLHLTLEACGRHVGMSPRTLSRLIHQQTGLSFGRWRRRLHLAAATSRLSAGDPVGTVAHTIGYDSPSAFITMFRRAMGMTPAQYAARAGKRLESRLSVSDRLSLVGGLQLLTYEGWLALAPLLP